jgi:uncharacterized protein YecT (DUF1311 family)
MKFFSVFFLLIINLIPNSREECSKLKKIKKKEKCFQSLFLKSEEQIESSMSELKLILDYKEYSQLLKNTSDWQIFKKDICESKKQSSKEKRKNLELYSCLQEQNTTRIDFLESFSNTNLEPKGLTGIYTDTLGGKLELKKKNFEKYFFNLEIDRGKIKTEGQIDGIIEFNKNLSKFSVDSTNLNKQSTSACELYFQIENKKIKVKEKSCQHFHSELSSFDGEYFKLR